MYEGSESVFVRFRVPNNLIDFPPVGEGCAGSRRIGEELFYHVASDLFWAAEDHRFESIDVIETFSIGQMIARIDFWAVLPSAFFRKGAIVLSPASNNIVAFQSKARRIDFLVASHAILSRPVPVQLIANGGGSANIWFHRRHVVRGWRNVFA